MIIVGFLVDYFQFEIGPEVSGEFIPNGLLFWEKDRLLILSKLRY